MIWFYIIVLFLSIALLVKSSDYFTGAAEELGYYIGLPAFLVGVTIVSIGTSLPELASSLFAVSLGHGEIVVGNVIGSNVANILLILGISSIVAKKLKITYEILHVDLPVLVLSSFLIAFMLYDGVFTWVEGLICIIGFVVYSAYAIQSRKKVSTPEKKKLSTKSILLLILCPILIYVGAKYCIESVLFIAEYTSIGTDALAATIIALGTSLPELVVSLVAASKHKFGIAIGNVLGSNIFNSFLVLGAPALIAPLVVSPTMAGFGILFMVASTLIFVFASQDKEVTKWEGYFLILAYIFFVTKMFGVI